MLIRENADSSIRVFLSIQATSILLWWGWLIASPAPRILFFGNDFEHHLLWVFLVPDFLVIACLSTWMSIRWNSTRLNKTLCSLLIGILLGGVNYAALVTMGLVYFGCATLLSAILMVLMVAANWMLLFVVRDASRKGPACG